MTAHPGDRLGDRLLGVGHHLGLVVIPDPDPVIGEVVTGPGHHRQQRGDDVQSHVLGGGINVPFQGELEGDGGGAKGADGGHLGEAADLAELHLQGGGD